MQAKVLTLVRDGANSAEQSRDVLLDVEQEGDVDKRDSAVERRASQRCHRRLSHIRDDVVALGAQPAVRHRFGKSLGNDGHRACVCDNKVHQRAMAERGLRRVVAQQSCVVLRDDVRDAERSAHHQRGQTGAAGHVAVHDVDVVSTANVQTFQRCTNWSQDVGRHDPPRPRLCAGIVNVQQVKTVSVFVHDARTQRIAFGLLLLQVDDVDVTKAANGLGVAPHKRTGGRVTLVGEDRRQEQHRKALLPTSHGIAPPIGTRPMALPSVGNPSIRGKPQTNPHIHLARNSAGAKLHVESGGQRATPHGRNSRPDGRAPTVRAGKWNANAPTGPTRCG